MKTHVFSVLVSICAFCMLLTSCGGNKQIVQSERKYTNPFEAGAFDVPCAVYDDDEYFAATGFASGAAERKAQLQLSALKNGQDVIAMKMQHAVEGEVMSFFEEVSSNGGTDVDAQVLGGVNSVIMGIVNNTSHCCLKFSGIDERGNVECYIGIKISKEQISNAVADNLSKSHKESIRQRAEEFRSKLAEDLKAYRGEE